MSAALFHWIVLSRMRLVAGVASVAAGELAYGVGNESADVRAAPVFDVWAGVGAVAFCERPPSATDFHSRKMDLCFVCGDCAVWDSAKSSFLSLRPARAGRDAAAVKPNGEVVSSLIPLSSLLTCLAPIDSKQHFPPALSQMPDGNDLPLFPLLGISQDARPLPGVRSSLQP